MTNQRPSCMQGQLFCPWIVELSILPDLAEVDLDSPPVKGSCMAGSIAMEQLKYKRVLIKVSGEALMGDQAFGIDQKVVDRVAGEIRDARELGAEICVVIGGGNIFRGVSVAAKGGDRVRGDHMGMLATVMNCLAMTNALENLGVPAVPMSAIAMDEICESFTQRGAKSHLAAGRVVLFAAGTGNPFFTTDSGAALRAAEMGCDALLKGTQVDGVYSADPKERPCCHPL